MWKNGQRISKRNSFERAWRQSRVGVSRMAGSAFLPWEDWIARLLHPWIVAIRRRIYARQRRRLLAESAGWPQTDGVIQNINADFANPREEITYVYSTQQGYFSGYFWRWFESSNASAVKIGDKLTLRYNEENHDQSIVVNEI
jgi:hypothetical protein